MWATQAVTRKKKLPKMKRKIELHENSSIFNTKVVFICNCTESPLALDRGGLRGLATFSTISNSIQYQVSGAFVI